MKLFFKRFSGTFAIWSQIFFTLIGQIALVPLFLDRWGVEKYGAWITIQAVLPVFSLLSYGFHSYLEFDFIRIGKNLSELNNKLQSSLLLAIIVSIFEMAIVGLVVYAFGGVENIGIKNDLAEEFNFVLLVMTLNWVLNVNVSGVLQRVLLPFDYYAKNAWWYLGSILVNLCSVSIALYFGLGVSGVAIAQFSMYSIYALFFLKYLKKELVLNSVNIVLSLSALGWKDFLNSILLSAKNLLVLIQQQGIRIFLSAISGPVLTAQFSTMRTVSNISLQAMGSIVNPVTPRFLEKIHARDFENSRKIAELLWIILVAWQGFFLVIFQCVAPSVFYYWTNGKIDFDVEVFCFFSISLLFYGCYQPLLLLVKGFNQGWVQLLVSCVAMIFMLGSLIVLGGLFYLSLAIFFGELIALVFYYIVVKKWENEQAEEVVFRKSLYWIFWAFLYSGMIFMVAKFREAAPYVVTLAFFCAICLSFTEAKNFWARHKFIGDE